MHSRRTERTKSSAKKLTGKPVLIGRRDGSSRVRKGQDGVGAACFTHPRKVIYYQSRPSCLKRKHRSTESRPKFILNKVYNFFFKFNYLFLSNRYFNCVFHVLIVCMVKLVSFQLELLPFQITALQLHFVTMNRWQHYESLKYPSWMWQTFSAFFH